jgi:hypothetical protein
MMPPRPAAIAVIMMPSPAAPSPATQTAARDRLREVGGGRRPRPPAALAADVAVVLQLTADDAHLLGAVSRGTLAGAMELRSQHLRGLKDVLTVNRNLELKLCEADAQVAAVQAQNDALEAELMRAETAKAPPVPPEGARAESTSQLLAHLRYADASAIKIQRICRGYLGRRRALREAVRISSGR